MPKNSFRSERRAARAARRRNLRMIIGAILVLLLAVAAYAAYINLRPDVTSLPSGLIIEDIEAGTGPEAKSGDTVSVHYTGYFQSAEEFDSSRGGDPFVFTLGERQVIEGWDLGVAGMKVGGLRKLTVPPELAYGADGYGPIPGNSTLIFEVELVEIQGQE